MGKPARPRIRKSASTAGRLNAALSPAEKRELVERLRKDGARIAARFGLRYRSIEAEDARVRRRYGSCHSNGVIRIRLFHAKTGRPLKYSSMVDTLCHEIAHLKYFHHGPSFRDFYEVILDWARREGIYRPAPRGVKAGEPEGAPDPLARLALAIAPNIARRLASCLQSGPADTAAKERQAMAEPDALAGRRSSENAPEPAPARPRAKHAPSRTEPLPQLELF